MSKKTCFIITPIDSKGSSIRRASDGLIDSVLVPVLNELNISNEVSHRISDSGSITNQIIKHLLEDELVIANLTDLNPNVMYELAVRHAVAKPTVILALTGTPLPFDVSADRVIFYKNDMQGVIDLKNELKTAINSAFKIGEPSDNPIYRVLKDTAIRKEVETKSPQAYILNEIQALNRKIADLTYNINQSRLEFVSSPSVYGGTAILGTNSGENILHSIAHNSPLVSVDLSDENEKKGL